MAIYPKTFFKESKIKVKPKSCFVMMPFGEPFDEIYREVIKEALEKYRFSVIRADELYGSTPIMEDILSNIESSEIIIADLSGKNPNVFYELGIAHTRKENHRVIIIAQDINDVPFDLRAYRVITYTPTISGAKKLAIQLENFLKEYSLKPIDWAGYMWKPISPEWYKDGDFLVGEIVKSNDLSLIFNTTSFKGNSKLLITFRAYSTGPEINFMFFTDGKDRFSGYHLWFWQGGVKLSRLGEKEIVAENDAIRMQEKRHYDIEVAYAEGRIVVSIAENKVIEYEDSNPLHKKGHLGFMGFNTYYWGPGGTVYFADFKVFTT